MIRRLKLKNFRKHETLDLKFTKGINCIIGRNASGKSTILRALKWMIYNKPSGNSVINWNKKKVEVFLMFKKGENKYIISRKKNRSSLNEYSLNGKPFKAFGSSVPSEISDIFNMGDLNFQGQHDAPFWFSCTAGEVSKQLNSIICLDTMDEAQKQLNSALYKKKNILEHTQEKIKTYQENLTKYRHVSFCYKKIKDIENKAIKNEQYKQKIVLMENALFNIKKLKNMRKIKKDFIEKAKPLLSKMEKIIEKQKKKKEVSLQILKLTQILNKMEKYRHDASLPVPDLSMLENKIEKLQTIDRKSKLLSLSLLQMETYRQKKEKAEKLYKKIEQEIQKVTKGLCPICKKPL